jgi:2-polyprenyl-3-methyl-5-hydroxy-6-metoxy-1,4-benzoquinol methylase
MKHVKVSCPVCKGAQLRVIARLEGAVLKKCRRCNLVINEYANAPAEKEYYKGQYEELYETYYKHFRSKQFDLFFKGVKELGLKGNRVLDIGCSYGLFLEKAKAQGFDALGLEPSRSAAGSNMRDKRMEVYGYDISELHKIPGTFDLITMWNVFEHLRDPANALDAVRKKLNDGGVFLLCVPNLKGLITELSFLVYKASIGRINSHLKYLYQLDNDYPHLFHYDRKNLDMLLRAHGFSAFSSKGNDIIDEDNIRQRIKAFSGNKVKQSLMGFLIKKLQRISKLLKKEDEILILARKA